MKFLLPALGALVLLSASGAAFAADEPPLPTLRTGAWGFDLQGEDPSVRPGDDFFAFANGGFLKALEIPADRASWGIDYILSETAQQRLRAILSSDDPVPPDARADAVKIRALYRAFMDESRANQRGAAPMLADLQPVRASRSRADLARILGRRDGLQASLFRLNIGQDEKSPDRYAVFVSQGGLGLPDRDYYLKPGFAEKKAAYQTYVAKMLKLAGWPGASAASGAVVAFETRIAEASWARVDERDPDKTYNPMAVSELGGAAPGFAWRQWLAAAGLQGVPRVIVRENTSLPKLAAIWNETPLPVLKAWAAFHLADNAAPYLADDFDQTRFAFRGTVLTGQPAERARWKRAVELEDGALGEALGRIYVARYFPPEAKQRIGALVGNLKIAMRARIEALAWMSPETKRKAERKLDTMVVKLGYPDRWRDYTRLQIRADDLYGDVKRARAFEWRRQTARLNQPVDRTEWGMTPQTVNAYYNPSSNEIVFPAAQLQPPYFDLGFDAAANYGGIGGVIGHEMTHAFDDEGRKFDETGALANWWTQNDAAGFEARADVLGKQFDTYEPLPGAHVNGKLTMGENIADLGGVLVAYDAWRAALSGKPAPMIGGLSGDQRFFLAYAQSWREKARDDSVRQQVVADPHSPFIYRVNGAVRNVDAWYAAFQVKPGDRLYLAPEQRARIW